MKVIVFGGSGFLGSHVADALTARGHEVSIFDLRPSPFLQKGQRMVVGDIRDRRAVEAAVRGHAVVYNFAGFADIEAASGHPIETIEANVLGNGVVLEAARRARVRRYVFASTVYVYSRAGSFYRASKRACEDYVQCYAQEYGLPYTILRFGSLYGPRADRRNGLYRLIEQALRRGRIEFAGEGDELREYIHVKDAAASSVDILDKSHANRCVVITGAQPIRARDLLTLIQEILGGKVRIVYRRPARGPFSLHYKLTPYSYVPQEALKLTRIASTDLGQGLLGVIAEMDRGRRRPEHGIRL